MSQLEHLIYVSRPRAGLGESDLARILDAARRHNATHGLTGFLAFSGEAFLQVLEGEARSLTRCLHALVRDARHSEVRLVDIGPLASRRFSGWSMGYAPVATRHLALLPGADGDPGAALRAIDAQAALRLLLAMAAERGDAAQALPEAQPGPRGYFSASSTRWPDA